METDAGSVEHTCKNCTTGMDGRPIDVLSYQPFFWSHKDCAQRAAERERLRREVTVETGDDSPVEAGEPVAAPVAAPVEAAASAPITEHSPGTSFAPEDFPTVVVESRPYVSGVILRPDPLVAVSETGVLSVEVGMVRLVLPTRTDWDKFVRMGNRLHSAQHQINKESAGVSDSDH